MPRTARLDIPDLLHHVIVRGIERSPVFIDDEDRLLFVRRLETLLVETGTECLAWALMGNHLHLLLRPHQVTLATFMRRLLTSHAVRFNLRHKRSGHLFQNRYKSIVCEEDTYLLELVRYIHLNPLRAGIIKSVDQLDSYPWTGHAVIMGSKELQGQNIVDVLSRFGIDSMDALRSYRLFIEDGIPLGHRDDLVGGGLRRSQPPNIDSKTGVEPFDARILGSGTFVESLLLDSESTTSKKNISLKYLAVIVAEVFKTSPDLLVQRIRTKTVSDARSVFCYISTCKLGFNGANVALFLNQSRSAVSLGSRRGAALLDSDAKLKEQIHNNLTI